MNTPTNTPQPQHTPTPWTTHEGSYGNYVAIKAGNKTVARIPWGEGDGHNAALICKAVNNHAQLVAIAELAEKREPEMMDKAEMRAVLVNLYEMARAALTAAQS